MKMKKGSRLDRVFVEVTANERVFPWHCMSSALSVWGPPQSFMLGEVMFEALRKDVNPIRMHALIDVGIDALASIKEQMQRISLGERDKAGVAT